MTDETTVEVAEAPIVFYCRECKKIVDEPVKKANKYEYSCPVCKSERVSFGTRQAVSDFFQAKLNKK